MTFCIFLYNGSYTYAGELTENVAEITDEELAKHEDEPVDEELLENKEEPVDEELPADKEETADEELPADKEETADEKLPADKEETADEESQENKDEPAVEESTEEEKTLGEEFLEGEEKLSDDQPIDTNGDESCIEQQNETMNISTYRDIYSRMTSNDYVKGYVERCYQYILGRSADESGLNTWTQKILDGYGGAEIVKDLIISDEFKAQGKNNAEVVEILYQAMLGRNSDPSGKENWLNYLNEGVSYRYIINGFAGSEEFKQICESYGISAGTAEITEARDRNIGVTGYVMRNYRKTLGRDADVDGLNTWAQKILSGHGGAEIVKDLMVSDEFLAKNPTNEEVIEILYQAMLGREADPEGKENWLNHLNNGVSYRYIINGFAGSQEFNQICSGYGIVAGTIEITETRDKNVGVTGYVTRCYRKILGRDADLNGLNHWCSMILQEGMTPKQIAHDFVFSSEYINKNLSNEQYIEMLYEVLLGRSSDQAGKKHWVSLLKNQMTREEVFWGFANSAEFEEILFLYGLKENTNVKIINAMARFSSTDKNVALQFSAQLSGIVNSSNNYYYLIQIENYTNEIVGEIARIEKAIDISYNSNDFDRSKLKEISMHKVALAVKLNDGSYRLISNPINVFNIEAIANNTEEIYKGASKKGLQGVYYANYLGNGSDIVDARSSNTKQTLINLDLATVVSTSPKSGYRAYTYKGNTYYFSELTDLKANVRSLNSGYQQYLYGNNGTTPVCVSLCLLLSYNPDNSYLIDPAARIQGHSYYMLNVREDRARETFEALFLYLGEIFGQKDCYVTNWILGNEINSSKAWNYSGNLDFDTYMECYTTAFRLLYSGVKTQKTGNTVSISLDNGWTAAPDTYAGKTTLDVFAQKINAQNPNISWSIAYHPYSYPLTRADFWNDYSNTTDSLSTKYISMRNIKVLTDYAGVLESAYGKVSETIRVLLTEQGYSYHAGAELQAQAITRGYYIAEFNDRIDAFIIRAVADDTGEMSGGLYLGLMNTQHDKRISFYVYEYMDSDIDQFCNVSASGTVSKENYTDFNKAKEIVCNTNWSSIVSGFNKTKLAAIK